MLKQVPTIKTTFSQLDFIKSLILAWKSNYNIFPSENQIGVLFSQWALETGYGKSCWNYNIGNVKAVDNPNEVIEYCALNNVWEIINGKKVILDSNNPGAWFRSFNSLNEGVAFHFDFLKNHRYKNAWQSVIAGDTADFAHQLKVSGYYTASESQYSSALLNIFNKYKSDKIFTKALDEVCQNEINPNTEMPKETKPTEIVVSNVSFWDKLKEFFSWLFKF